eukprot:gene3509-2460_t
MLICVRDGTSCVNEVWIVRYTRVLVSGFGCSDLTVGVFSDFCFNCLGCCGVCCLVLLVGYASFGSSSLVFYVILTFGVVATFLGCFVVRVCSGLHSNGQDAGFGCTYLYFIAGYECRFAVDFYGIVVFGGLYMHVWGLTFCLWVAGFEGAHLVCLWAVISVVATFGVCVLCLVFAWDGVIPEGGVPGDWSTRVVCCLRYFGFWCICGVSDLVRRVCRLCILVRQELDFGCTRGVIFLLRAACGPLLRVDSHTQLRLSIMLPNSILGLGATFGVCVLCLVFAWDGVIPEGGVPGDWSTRVVCCLRYFGFWCICGVSDLVLRQELDFGCTRGAIFLLRGTACGPLLRVDNHTQLRLSIMLPNSILGLGVYYHSCASLELLVGGIRWYELWVSYVGCYGGWQTWLVMVGWWGFVSFVGWEGFYLACVWRGHIVDFGECGVGFECVEVFLLIYDAEGFADMVYVGGISMNFVVSHNAEKCRFVSFVFAG